MIIIGICPKVIKDFSNTNLDRTSNKLTNEIRCLTECDVYTLHEQLNGVCKYMKFKHEKTATWNFQFANNKHHHYHCCLSLESTLKHKIKAIQNLPALERLSFLRTSKVLNNEETEEKLRLQIHLTSKYSFIKTHSIYYSELIMLYKMSIDDINSETSDENDVEADND